MSYRLSRQATADIAEIFRFGIEEFGVEQALRYHEGMEQAFEFLVRYPRAVRLRFGFAEPVRIMRYQSHLIIYKIDMDDGIFIIRIRNGREDWVSDPA